MLILITFITIILKICTSKYKRSNICLFITSKKTLSHISRTDFSLSCQLILQDPTGAWVQQADPNQWTSGYYGYGYDAYSYGVAQDPSVYAYGAYGGYGYPQQARITEFLLILVNFF